MPVPDWLESSAVVALITGVLLIAGQNLSAWWQRRRTEADTRKANAEASEAQAMTDLHRIEASKASAEQLAELWAMINALTSKINALDAERAKELARSHALDVEVTDLKKQQGINIATIAALNSQNATTLKMNNELLLENRLLHQRVGQLENELSTERQANAVLNQRVKSLEARITELESRSPT